MTIDIVFVAIKVWSHYVPADRILAKLSMYICGFYVIYIHCPFDRLLWWAGQIEVGGDGHLRMDLLS